MKEKVGEGNLEFRRVAARPFVRLFSQPVPPDGVSYAAPVIDLSPCWYGKLLCSIVALIVMLLLSAVQAGVSSPAVAADPEPGGWYAGDPHVHRSCGGAPESVTDLRNKMSPKNLAVISLLADMGNGEVQDPATTYR